MSARSAIIAGLFCLLSACAAHKDPQDKEKLDGVTVAVGGQGAQAETRSVTFKGQVAYRVEGRVVPLSNVTFTRYDNPEQPPTVLPLPVDAEGQFEGELVLVANGKGAKKWDGTTVVVDSPGCSSLKVPVNDRWKPKTLELECLFR